MNRELAFVTMATQQIMSNPLDGEMPLARIKQVAIMTLIVVEKMHVATSPVTLTWVVEKTGLSRTAAIQTIEPLVQRGLLVETLGKNSMGRGTARQFRVPSDILDGYQPQKSKR